MGRVLRQMMLTTPASENGMKPTADFPHVYGVLLDWPIGEQTATIFSTCTGSASVYTTSTFGIIGGEGHATVRAAALEFTRAAGEFFDSATPVTESPYPAEDRVRFYLLTFEDVRVIDVEFAAIENGTSKHTDLFSLGQDVFTELRLCTEKKQ